MKTYKLTYEAADVMHALFDRSASVNKWAIRASFLKENLDYFSPKVEQLDIFHNDEKMTFLSFTEKVVTVKNGNSLRIDEEVMLMRCRNPQAATQNDCDSQRC